MNLKKIVSNSEQIFKTAESESFEKACLNFSVEIIRPIIRGGLLGGAAGYFLGGDLHSAKIGAEIGILLDVGTDLLRLGGLSYLYRNDKNQYNQYKKEDRLKII